MTTSIRILCQQPGFRRAGMAHPAERTYPADRFTATELAQLRAEPLLTVDILDGEPAETITPQGRSGTARHSLPLAGGVDGDGREEARPIAPSTGSGTVPHASAEVGAVEAQPAAPNDLPTESATTVASEVAAAPATSAPAGKAKGR